MLPPEDRPDWRYVSAELTRSDLANRLAGRWLTSTAATVLVVGLLGLATITIFLTGGQELPVTVFLVAAALAVVAAISLTGWTLFRGGTGPSVPRRLSWLLHGGDAAPPDELERELARFIAESRDHETLLADRAARLRVGAGLLLAAVVFGAGALAVSGVADDDPAPHDGPEAADRGSAEASGTDLTDAELAERFRPVLLFDREERWRPLDAERFLAEGIHEICPGGPKGTCRGLPGADGMQADASSSARLRVNGETRRRASLYKSPHADCRVEGLFDCDRGETTRIYYHVDRSDPGWAYVDYWWFLRYNDAPARAKPFHHQSDWEGVVVAVDLGRPGTFDWVGFASHTGVYRYLREDLSCEGARQPGSCGAGENRFGRRVDVYVANGTHAAYPVACRGRLSVRAGFCVQTASTRLPVIGRRIHIFEGGYDGDERWGANDDPDALAPFPDADWVRWPGRWDLTGHVGSPANQQRFKTPGAFARPDCPRDLCRGLAPRGYAAACFGWFGRTAAATACDPKTLRRGDQGGTAAFSIRRGRVEDGQLASNLDELNSASSRGVAQLTGSPLAPGEAAVVEGPAPASTELYVRAVRGEDVIEVRFDDLGLASGGTAVARVLRAGDDLRVELLRPDGSVSEPAQPPVVLAGELK